MLTGQAVLCGGLSTPLLLPFLLASPVSLPRLSCLSVASFSSRPRTSLSDSIAAHRTDRSRNGQPSCQCCCCCCGIAAEVHVRPSGRSFIRRPLHCWPAAAAAERLLRLLHSLDWMHSASVVGEVRGAGLRLPRQTAVFPVTHAVQLRTRGSCVSSLFLCPYVLPKQCDVATTLLQVSS